MDGRVGLPETIEGYPKSPKKDIHEGPRRRWRRLERNPPEVANGRKDFHEKAKRYPRRATKNGEGPRRRWRRLERDPPKVGKGVREGTLRGWRRLKRNPQKVGQGEKTSTKGAKVSVKEVRDSSAKGLQGVGKDSKGVREGPRRTLKYSTNAHPIIEPASFACGSFLSC